MKNLLKFSFLIGFLFISANVMANDKDFSISIDNINAKKLSFQMTNAKNVALYVYNDKQGELLAEKIRKHDEVSRTYDLKNFPAGTYYLVAESDSKIEKYKITIDETNASIEKTPVSEILKPEYTIEGNHVKLVMPKLTDGVTVSVQDFTNTVYYNQNLTPNNGELVVQFDLNPENADAYVISVQKGENTFNKIIYLK
ncbi:MAG: DUF3244 domain-containing protein [Cloacibacterium normanense]|nr:DUF3244 domain-containing protein [Cloacibacterium normanense]HCO19907.1 hypothetical protein [Flavobacteriaceae bacterium]